MCTNDVTPLQSPSTCHLNEVSSHNVSTSSTVISETTGVDVKDVVSTLLDLGLLKYIRTEYYIVNDKEAFERILGEMGEPRADRRIDRTCLHWNPPSLPATAKTESPAFNSP
ncbi:unnamed protein product [Mesocestoides corti]|uniref:Uncharacterized protein n=2 Tax=Mesocestoides corti TaxID=53468 RepID=A0A0R3URA9_MESCO|nr:unnamed protein product [Mesocestoides corti]